MQANIRKLYISNFLIGLVFWYGIEKLFMRSIGITALGIGLVTSLEICFNLIFDIPAGLLADRWSRKGVLIVATAAMALGSIVLGASHHLLPYAIGYVLYGVYIVCTSGTYSALTYDVLHEAGESKRYSRVQGRAYALFLAGAGFANIFSGFIAHATTYSTVFFLSVIPCAINALVILSIKEPIFHKLERKEKMLTQIKSASKAIADIRLLRVLVIVMSSLTIVEVFKSDFGQLYFLRYISAPQLLGIIWALYAFSWSIGSWIAHHFTKHMNALIWASVLPMVAMSFIDHWFSLVLFMVQAVASAALFNQIETRIQDATPSAVRASILSVVNNVGRAVSVPASFALGYSFQHFQAFWTLRYVTAIAVLTLIYWMSSRKMTYNPSP